MPASLLTRRARRVCPTRVRRPHLGIALDRATVLRNDTLSLAGCLAGWRSVAGWV